MKLRAYLSILFLLTCTAVLSACGFSMRGTGVSANLPFKTIYVNISNQTEFGLMLRRYLRSYQNVRIVEKPKDAEISLFILSETRNNEILSLNSQGRAREYSLIYNVGFRVDNNKGQPLLAPTVISLRRTLTYNESEALSKEGEERMLYQNMSNDAAQQIIWRLGVLNLSQGNQPDSQDAVKTGNPR